jgi:cbb3-type cytochrome oxidase maturation protein
VSVLFVLVPLAILLVAIFVGAYVWSSRTGQFDDLTTPAMRALHDDSPAPREP